jgi:hypothetical protein
LKNNFNGIAIVLAWPQTFCKQAGAWYDRVMYLLGINAGGYYKVGHAAIVLVDCLSGSCHYYDFGRYHAPHGFGRVRSAKTDHDLNIQTKAMVNGNEIINLEEILIELSCNPSTHGSGTIYGSQIPIDFARSFRLANDLQDKDFISYGPFIATGTNCSRFVNNILKAGCTNIITKTALRLPWMLTPTPMWNLKALRQEIVSIEENIGISEELLDKPEMQFQL